MAMYEGNWKCSRCGGAITQLPFQPRSEAGLTCRTCYAKGKDTAATKEPIPEMQPATEAPDLPNYDPAQVATEPMSADEAFAGMETATPVAAEQTGATGNWSCASCGAAITSLPFTPRRTDNLKCLDCFKQSKA